MTTKYNKPFRNFAHALGTLGFPIVSKFIGDEGNVAKVTSNGELKVAVSGEVNIGDVTLDGVTIKDKDGNEAKVTSDGSQLVQLMGGLVTEQKTQADAVGGVVTFAAPISAIEIFNKGAATGTFTVNGFAITVPAGAAWSRSLGGTPSPNVTVAGATEYEIRRLT